MNKTEVCMFCRYRKIRAAASACCAAREVLGDRTGTATRAVQGAARAVPERLRHPAPRPR